MPGSGSSRVSQKGQLVAEAGLCKRLLLQQFRRGKRWTDLGLWLLHEFNPHGVAASGFVVGVKPSHDSLERCKCLAKLRFLTLICELELQELTPVVDQLKKINVARLVGRRGYS